MNNKARILTIILHAVGIGATIGTMIIDSKNAKKEAITNEQSHEELSKETVLQSE